jgi:hypothetical protein
MDLDFLLLTTVDFEDLDDLDLDLDDLLLNDLLLDDLLLNDLLLLIFFDFLEHLLPFPPLPFPDLPSSQSSEGRALGLEEIARAVGLGEIVGDEDSEGAREGRKQNSGTMSPDAVSLNSNHANLSP